MAYKILTVDDSKTIRMIVKKAFSPYNCELFEGENGVEGLAIANKEKPDLIILDITMPVMTGIEEKVQVATHSMAITLAVAISSIHSFLPTMALIG